MQNLKRFIRLKMGGTLSYEKAMSTYNKTLTPYTNELQVVLYVMQITQYPESYYITKNKKLSFYRNMKGNTCFPDFGIDTPNKRFLIEIDDDSHFTHDKMLADAHKMTCAYNNGYAFIRISNKALHSNDNWKIHLKNIINSSQKTYQRYYIGANNEYDELNKLIPGNMLYCKGN